MELWMAKGRWKKLLFVLDPPNINCKYSSIHQCRAQYGRVFSLRRQASHENAVFGQTLGRQISAISYFMYKKTT